jgi:hypothetical protein
MTFVAFVKAARALQSHLLGLSISLQRSVLPEYS